MNPASIIPTITALARAGAAVQAWRLFDAHGLAGADDPAAQALHGRLLKDKALAATGAERRALAAQAAAAYLASARLRPATYPLVNAATLALIAGDAAGAAVMAGEVLALMEVAPEPDTPWWQAATRAEALLLMVDEAGARAALADAMALAPLAWEDHAVTLRQFATIIAEQGGDAAWLEPLRPPRSLHFTGAMRLGEAEPALAARIDAIIAAENIGFGFGALAAGADLLVAERLLAAGAELHIVLPGGEAAFRARSVTPFGADARYDAMLDAAASVRAAGEDAAFAQAIQLGDEMAMGLAAMHAAQMQSSAVQLVIGAGLRAGQTARLWQDSGRSQILLDIDTPAGPPLVDTPVPVRLVAVLAIALARPDDGLAGAMAMTARLPLPAMAGEIAPRQASADGYVLFFDSPLGAAQAGLALQAALAGSGPMRLAADYDAMASVDGGLFGPVAARTLRLLGATPDSGLTATEALVSALAARTSDGIAAEFVGEVKLSPFSEAVRLYGLRRR